MGCPVIKQNAAAQSCGIGKLEENFEILYLTQTLWVALHRRHSFLNKF